MVYPSAFLMSFEKQELTIDIASLPDTRITARAETPEGVAGAIMVSSKLVMDMIRSSDLSYTYCRSRISR